MIEFDSSLAGDAGEEGSEHGQDEARASPASLEEATCPFVADPIRIGFLVVMFEQGTNLVGEEACELFTNDDAPPKRGEGLEAVAELGQPREEDGDPIRAAEVGLDQGPRLAESFLGEVGGVVEPDEEPLRFFVEETDEFACRLGMSPPACHMDLPGEDANEARSPEEFGLREVGDPVAPRSSFASRARRSAVFPQPLSAASRR